jgi:hypothetical protein
VAAAAEAAAGVAAAAAEKGRGSRFHLALFERREGLLPEVVRRERQAVCVPLQLAHGGRPNPRYTRKVGHGGEAAMPLAISDCHQHSKECGHSADGAPAQVRYFGGRCARRTDGSCLPLSDAGQRFKLGGTGGVHVEPSRWG